MNVLSGYKTYITAGAMLVLAVADIVTQSSILNSTPSDLIMSAVGLFFARQATSNVAKSS